MPTDCDHLSICRPDSRESLVYLDVKKFIQRCSFDTDRSKVNTQEKSQRSLESGMFVALIPHLDSDRPFEFSGIWI